MKLPVTEMDIQIRFADINISAHVSNHVFGQYFELARVCWFDQITKNMTDTVVATITIDFMDEVLLEDQVMIRTSCIEKGNKSFKLQQLLYANGKLAVRCTVVLVGFDLETRKSTAVLDDWEPSGIIDG